MPEIGRTHGSLYRQRGKGGSWHLAKNKGYIPPLPLNSPHVRLEGRGPPLSLIKLYQRSPLPDDLSGSELPCLHAVYSVVIFLPFLFFFPSKIRFLFL